MKARLTLVAPTLVVWVARVKSLNPNGDGGACWDRHTDLPFLFLPGFTFVNAQCPLSYKSVTVSLSRKKDLNVTASRINKLYEWFCILYVWSSRLLVSSDCGLWELANSSLQFELSVLRCSLIFEGIFQEKCALAFGKYVMCLKLPIHTYTDR